MLIADVLTYLTQFLAGAAYAAVLEVGLKRRYEPDYTWATVVWGTAQVGLIVAARLALAPPPAQFQIDLVWWVWWLWTWSFVAAGAPIVFWQMVVQRGRIAQLVAYLQRNNEP